MTLPFRPITGPRAGTFTGPVRSRRTPSVGRAGGPAGGRSLLTTIVAHSLPVATALAEHPHAHVVAVGATTAEAYRRVRADLCVLGTASMHPELGVGVLNQEEAEVKRAMVAGSAEVMLVATGEKLNTSAPFVVGPASLVTRLVTDAGVPEDAVRPYRQAGVEVVRAGGH